MLSIYAVLGLPACRTVIDLDTERTVTATNLPEITDVSPKYGFLNTRIIITGRNFHDVQKVLLDTMQFDSVRVENASTIRCVLRYTAGRVAEFYAFGWRDVSVVTKRGTAVVRSIYATGTGIVGRITSSTKDIPDSVHLVIYERSGAIGSQHRSGVSAFGKGAYHVTAQAGDFGRWRGNTYTIRPFLHGYGFRPIERIAVPLEVLLGEQDFEAVRVPAEQMPQIKDIKPLMGESYSSGEKTGSEIALTGKGFTGIRKILFGVFYSIDPLTSDPSIYASNNELNRYEEATTFTVVSDTLLKVNIPRLNSRRIYSYDAPFESTIYLLRDDAAATTPQRIRIKYSSFDNFF